MRRASSSTGSSRTPTAWRDGGPDWQCTPPRPDGLRRAPGGHQRWTEVFPADPGLRVNVELDLAEVVDGELLDGGITRWASACGGSASELGRAQCSSQPRPPRPV